MLFVLIFYNVQPVVSMAAPKPDKSKQVPDVLILEVKEGVNLEEDFQGKANHKFRTNSLELDAALNTLGVHGLKPLFPPGQAKRDSSAANLERIYLIKLKPNTDIEAAIAALSGLADLTFAEPDYFTEAEDDPTPTGTPSPPTDSPINDPRYPEQWALPAIGAPSA